MTIPKLLYFIVIYAAILAAILLALMILDYWMWQNQVKERAEATGVIEIDIKEILEQKEKVGIQHLIK